VTDINALSRAELAALVVETLAAKYINVVLVGGSCVCLYTNERFVSFDLDFIDLSYSRKRKIAEVLKDIGFYSKGASRYFERDGCQWSIEFPSAPLAIGQEQITADKIAEIETKQGTVRLLSPTDSVKDRLLWWYLESDRQCWKQAQDIARNHSIGWEDLAAWHESEGYGGQLQTFRESVIMA
jgi:hypothetical protein